MTRTPRTVQSLRGTQRSNPSKPGGTAGTERARSWHLRAEGWATILEWTRGQDLDGGATLENPRRGVRASGSVRMVNGFTPGDRMSPESMAAEMRASAFKPPAAALCASAATAAMMRKHQNSEVSDGV